MNKLSKGVLREIRKSKFQYSGTIVLLALAVMLYVMLNTSIHALEESNEQFVKQYVQEDFHVFTGTSLKKQQMEELEQKYQVLLEERKGKDVFLGKGKSLRVFTIPETVNIPYVEDGKLPEKDNEIAIAQSYATANGLSVGDTLTIGQEKWTISGTIYLPDYVYMLKNVNDLIQDPASFGIALVSDKGFERLEGTGVIFYSGHWKKGEQADEFRAALSSITPIILWMNGDENPRITYIETEIQGTKTTTKVFPLFIAGIVVMMVLVLLKRRLELQRSQLGTLLSIGYRKGEIVRAFLLYPVLIGLVGSVLGIVSGLFFSIPITEIYTQFFNLPLLHDFQVNVEALVFALIVPLSLLCLVSWYVIARQLRQSPIDLLRPSLQQRKNRIHRERFIRFRLKKFSSRFRLRMLTRHIGRMILLSMGIILATVLLMYGFISMNSMDTLLNKTYKESFKYEYAYYFQELQRGDAKSGDPFTFAEGSILSVNGKKLDEDQTVSVYGIDPSVKLLRLENDQGERLLSSMGEGAIVTKALAYALNVQEGDELLLWSESNQKKLSVTVKGIAEIYTGTSIYMNREAVNDWAGYPDGAYVGIWTKEPLSHPQGVYMTESKEDMIQSFQSIMKPMRYSLFIMSGLAFVIGVIIVSLITNLIVDENTITISLMKIMGYQDRSIASLILNIYTPVVFVSYLLGIPISLFSIDALVRSIADETNYVLPVGVDYRMAVLGLFFIYASYYASLWISRRKLKKVSLQEVLKGQER
ncbi:ABC transporter permease [Thermolongibacillus altinsuensis]